MKYLGNPASGSQANTTASRNAFGQYFRSRATPVNPDSTRQTVVRSILSTLARAWKTLTDNQRVGWKSLSLQIPRTDSLGQSHNLSGFQEYISLNAKRNAFGEATINDAPGAPSTLDSLSNITMTHSGANLNVAFTSSGALTGQRIGVYVSPQKSAGTGYVSDLRLLQTTAAAPVSPIQIGANYAARFGGLVTGNRVFVSLEPYNAGFTNPGVIGTIVL
jgi:hypothetical protein